MAESFGRLEEHQVLSTEIAASMARAAGLRNVIAHGYGGIDAALVYQAADPGLRDLRSFVAEVSKWLRGQ